MMLVFGSSAWTRRLLWCQPYVELTKGWPVNVDLQQGNIMQIEFKLQKAERCDRGKHDELKLAGQGDQIRHASAGRFLTNIVAAFRMVIRRLAHFQRIAGDAQ
jgi:hypothetical protein